MGRKGLSEEKQLELVKDYQDPKQDCYHSTTKVGEKHQIGAPTVSKYLVKHGVEIVGRGRTFNEKIKREPKKRKAHNKKPEKPRHDIFPEKHPTDHHVGGVIKNDVEIKKKSNSVTKAQVDSIIQNYTWIHGPYYLKLDDLAKLHNIDPQMLTDLLKREDIIDKFGRLNPDKAHAEPPPEVSNKEVKPPNRVTPEEFYNKVFDNVKSELKKIFPKGSIITISFDIEL